MEHDGIYLRESPTQFTGIVTQILRAIKLKFITQGEFRDSGQAKISFFYKSTPV
jgi:hypothetical protein